MQQAAIRELSTPIIEVWAGVLCLPVVGIVDSQRSAEMTETLLETIVAKQARMAIVDITGIDVMDTKTADHFIKMAARGPPARRRVHRQRHQPRHRPDPDPHRGRPDRASARCAACATPCSSICARPSSWWCTSTRSSRRKLTAEV